MSPVKNNFKAHKDFIHRLDELIKRMLPGIDKETVKEPWPNFNYSILERIRYNLLAVAYIIPQAEERTTFQLPIGLLYRTILVDLILYKFLRQVAEQVGNQAREAGVPLEESGKRAGEAFEIEMDVVSSEFLKALLEIYGVVESQTPDANLIEYFKKQYADYIIADDNGEWKIKSAHQLRTQEQEYFLKKHISDEKINTKLERLKYEGAKLEFIKEPNKSQIAIMNAYLSQFHHFTNKSHILYKQHDHLEANIDYSRDILQLSVAVCTTICKHLLQENAIYQEFEKLHRDLGEFAAATDVYRRQKEVARK